MKNIVFIAVIDDERWSQWKNAEFYCLMFGFSILWQGIQAIKWKNLKLLSRKRDTNSDFRLSTAYFLHLPILKEFVCWFWPKTIEKHYCTRLQTNKLWPKLMNWNWFDEIDLSANSREGNSIIEKLSQYNVM